MDAGLCGHPYELENTVRLIDYQIASSAMYVCLRLVKIRTCFALRHRRSELASDHFWFCRKVTGDSQHLPDNWQQQVEDMNLRIAITALQPPPAGIWRHP